MKSLCENGITSKIDLLNKLELGGYTYLQLKDMSSPPLELFQQSRE